MPVEQLGEAFSYDFGRPTKEHYSVCGLILLRDYFGWTNEETIDKYLYDLKVQYALKIQPDNLNFGSRTLERYLKLFREKELARALRISGRLKHFTPLRRLGVRGKLAVYNGIYSILTVHNIMQMAKFYKKKTVKTQKKPGLTSKTAFTTPSSSRLCRLCPLEIQMAA
ncbi:MAG: hypothetical protein A2017_15180 [Lentisphaerae bacterium GWF2_44_16]|nr:MAG: hypothetical protein A2017_15180 [Lentisphaerae bacterium GWF2_44_16]